MIDLFLWRTPNGYKPLIFVEEAELEYQLYPVDISKGEQFSTSFLNISPNNKIPAMIDGDNNIFESGAILLYLAQKTGKFMPTKPADHYQVMQWLMWQIGGLGPMMGQLGHFKNSAPEEVPYALVRYSQESHRLVGVLEKQLQKSDFVAGDYSIADMAIYPWIYAANGSYLGFDFTDYPKVKQWMERISQRPAVVKSYKIGATF